MENLSFELIFQAASLLKIDEQYIFPCLNFQKVKSYGNKLTVCSHAELKGYTMLEELITEVSRGMNSPSTLRRRNLETQQPPVILDFWLRKTLAGKSHYLRKSHRFRKASFSNVFRPTLKRKAGVFKFLRFEKRFRKAPVFFDGAVWT